MRKHVSAPSRSASGSVRKTPKHQWAKELPLAQAFRPLRRQPPPPASRTAWARRTGRSLALSGSDQAWHQISSPAAIAGKKRSFWAAVPTSSRVGPRRKMPSLLTRSGARRPVVLLFEDEPLHDPETPAAVLRGPAHGGPSVREHGRFPGLVGFEPGCGGNRGQGLGGDMSGQPRTGLAPKGLVLGTEGQVHAAANLAHRRVDYQAGGRGITGGGRAGVANCHRAGISRERAREGGEIFAGRAGFSRSPFRRQCSRHTYGRVIGGLKHRRSGYWRGDANCGLLTSIFWEARR